MTETCNVCGRLLKVSDAVSIRDNCMIHTRCIAKPTDNARQLLTTLNTDELFTIRENLESRYMRLRGELDEINSCV